MDKFLLSMSMSGADTDKQVCPCHPILLGAWVPPFRLCTGNGARDGLTVVVQGHAVKVGRVVAVANRDCSGELVLRGIVGADSGGLD